MIDDIDGGLRMRPDIGADEFGACCALSTTEVTGSTNTITGTSQFEMRFNAATGGGIDQLYDLVEDPTKTYDLAGGVNDLRTLHDFEIAPNGGAFSGVNHTTEDNSSGSRVDLLEATSTRVRVRQDALFQADGGTNILGGIEGFGDYSVYGSGRTAVGWTEKDWNTPLFTYARRQIGMAAHYTGSAPLNSYTPCYEGNAACNSSGAGGAAADWLLGVRNSAGARTDFLTILSQDWVQATTVEYLALSGAAQGSPTKSGSRPGRAPRPARLEPAHLLQAHELRRGGGPARSRRDQPQHRLPHPAAPGSRRASRGKTRREHGERTSTRRRPRISSVSTRLSGCVSR